MSSLWKPTELGEVFAQREIELSQGGHSRGTATVLVGRPVPDPGERGPWWCPLQILGLGSDALVAVAGEDSLQALTLALDYLRDHVPMRARELGFDVTWLGAREDVIFCHLERAREQTHVSTKLIAKLHDAIALASTPDSPERRAKLDELRKLVKLLSPGDEEAV